MAKLMEFKSAFTWVLIFLGMTLVADAAPPTVVLSIHSIDDVLDDADYIGEAAGTPGVKETAEQFLNNFTGGAGLAGVDREKPLGLYWTMPAAISNDIGSAVLFLPVSDAGAFKKLVGMFVPNLKVTGDQWEMSVAGQAIFGRVVDEYLYLSNSADGLQDVSSPEKIVNSDYTVAIEVNIASIPKDLKQTFLEVAEREGRNKLASGPKPKSDAEEMVQKMAFEGFLAVLKSVVNDGDKLTFGYQTDDDTPVITLDLGLTGKSNTSLSKSLAVYAKTPPAYSAVAGDSVPLRVAFSVPTTGLNEYIDPLFAALKKSADESIANDATLKDDADKAAAKDVSRRLLGILQSTVKSGVVNSITILEEGDDDTVRVISGTKLAKGDDAAKLLDDILKLSKESPETAKVKTDVDKHAGARIHSIEGNFDDKQAALFGDNPAHLAIRADSLWFALGGGNLGSLKAALEASGKKSDEPGAPISIRTKPAKLVTLLEQNDAGLVQRAEGIAGEDGDVFNIELIPTEKGGIKLRVEVGIELIKLGTDH